jgi:hypothetical protein
MNLSNLATTRPGRPFWLALIAVAMPSCSLQSRAVSKCETLLLATLKAPASYRRVTDLVGPTVKGRQSVVITYDAVNSYNAPLRDTFLCQFDPATGTASPSDDDSAVVADDLSIPVENLIDATPVARPTVDAPVSSKPSPQPAFNAENEDDEVPVCDRPDSPEKSELMNEIGTDCLGD